MIYRQAGRGIVAGLAAINTPPPTTGGFISQTFQGATMETLTVCCVGRDGARTAPTPFGSVPVWTGKIYVAKPRQRDGVFTWRFAGTFGGTRSGIKPSRAFLSELSGQAEHPWLAVRHGELVQTTGAAT